MHNSTEKKTAHKFAQQSTLKQPAISALMKNLKNLVRACWIEFHVGSTHRQGVPPKRRMTHCVSPAFGSTCTSLTILDGGIQRRTSQLTEFSFPCKRRAVAGGPSIGSGALLPACRALAGSTFKSLSCSAFFFSNTRGSMATDLDTS